MCRALQNLRKDFQGSHPWRAQLDRKAWLNPWWPLMGFLMGPILLDQEGQGPL